MDDFKKALAEVTTGSEDLPIPETKFVDGAWWARDWIYDRQFKNAHRMGKNSMYMGVLQDENQRLREALEKSIKWDRKIYERYPSNTDAGAWAIESLKIKRQALAKEEK